MFFARAWSHSAQSWCLINICLLKKHSSDQFVFIENALLKNHIFLIEMLRKGCLFKKFNWIIFFLYYQEIQYFSPKNMILVFRRKMKDEVSQKMHRNIIFSVYWVKMVFLFPRNMILPLCWKIKLIFSQENVPDDDISSIIKQEDIPPRKYDISSDRKR